MPMNNVVGFSEWMAREGTELESGGLEATGRKTVISWYVKGRSVVRGSREVERREYDIAHRACQSR